MKRDHASVKKMWLGIALLALASPAGILLPARFDAGSAWGEWSAAELGRMLGYLPQGMQRIGGLWRAPLPGYGFHGTGHPGLGGQSFAYVVSALVGVAVVAAVVLVVGKLTLKDD